MSLSRNTLTAAAASWQAAGNLGSGSVSGKRVSQELSLANSPARPPYDRGTAPYYKKDEKGGKLMDLHEGYMSKVRNILTSLGVFWLSLWVAGGLGRSLSKLNDGIVYGDSVLSALAMGVMSSMHRTLAAALAGVLVTVVVEGRKPVLWALIVAALYIVAAPVR